MPIADNYTREERRIRLVLGLALGLLLLTVALALLVRYRPDAVAAVLQLPESAEPGPPPGVAGYMTGLDSARDTMHLTTTSEPATPLREVPEEVEDSTTQATGGGAADTSQASDASPPRQRRSRVRTDVVLLPCSLKNPRPDGGFIVPPHNPRHRTIVGLPSAPGEPRRGFVIPPHDPTEENRLSIDVISMDSVLDATLRVPPHNPDSFNVVRRDSLPCRADSTPGNEGR